MTYKAIKINGVKKDLHRVIAEKMIGRPLLFNEVVHHIDGDKLNNRQENLEIMSRSDHSRMHMTGNIRSAETKEKLHKIGIKQRTRAKISIQQAKDAKEMLRNNFSCKEISILCDIPRGNVSKIKRGKIWAWVE